MWPVSPQLLRALTSSHQVSATADLLKGGQVLYSGLPVTGGTVTINPRSSKVARSLDCTIAPELRISDYAAERTIDSGRLGVFGHEIRLSWTVHFPGGGSASVPLGLFRVDTIDGDLSGGSEVTVTGSSRESYVADARFVNPRSESSPSARSLIGGLIGEVLSGAEVVMSASREARVPQTTWDNDRWEAIDSLCDMLAAGIRTDGLGRFIVYDLPTIDSPPVWTIRSGVGGTLVSARATMSRSGIRNGWVVRGGSPSSDVAPTQAVVRDTGASSPTRWGDPDTGAFGMVPEFVQIESLTTLEQCRTVAAAKLAQSTGAWKSLDLSMIPNPALERDDVVQVIVDDRDPAGSVERHLIDSGTFDITPGGEFRLATRDVRQVEVTYD